MAHIPGKLLVIWDGAPIHRAQVVKDFLAQDGAARLWREQLPAYAPELNSDEGIGNRLKRVELPTCAATTLPSSGSNSAWPLPASASGAQLSKGASISVARRYSGSRRPGWRGGLDTYAGTVFSSTLP